MSKGEHSISTIYIGDWRVDAPTNRLTLNDREVKVETKVMDVLMYLARHPGELVTREDLERNVWKGRIVSYESLTSTINKLRKVLEDDPKNPRFIETVPKKGYRLVAPTRTASENVIDDGELFTEKNRQVSSYRALGIAVLAALLLVIVLILKYWYAPTRLPGHISNTLATLSESETPSLIVLPFSDLSSSATQQYLGDGITDDLTTALSKLSGLLVIARSTAVNFKTRSMHARQIARELQVDYVLEGSVRREGDKLRVNTKLIDGKTGFNLWAEQYDRQIEDIFNVQDDITAKIVEALSVELTEQERKRTARKYTASLDAYEKFLQGQQIYMRSTRDDNIRAREIYQHSIELDPGFARAYSALALTYIADYRFNWSENREESIDKALELAKKAVALDDQLPQAHWVQGYSYLQHRQYDKAIEAANRAIEVSPSYADGFATLGICLTYAGDPQTGIQFLQRAMRLNPQYPAAYASALGQAYYFTQRYEAALSILRQAVERNPNLLTSQVFLIATLSRLEQHEDANWAAVQLRTLAPGFELEDLGKMFPLNDTEKLQQLKNDLKTAGL